MEPWVRAWHRNSTAQLLACLVLVVDGVSLPCLSRRCNINYVFCGPGDLPQGVFGEGDVAVSDLSRAKMEQSQHRPALFLAVFSNIDMVNFHK